MNAVGRKSVLCRSEQRRDCRALLYYPSVCPSGDGCRACVRTSSYVELSCLVVVLASADRYGMSRPQAAKVPRERVTKVLIWATQGGYYAAVSLSPNAAQVTAANQVALCGSLQRPGKRKRKDEWGCKRNKESPVLCRVLLLLLL